MCTIVHFIKSKLLNDAFFLNKYDISVIIKADFTDILYAFLFSEVTLIVRFYFCCVVLRNQY